MPVAQVSNPISIDNIISACLQVGKGKQVDIHEAKALVAVLKETHNDDLIAELPQMIIEQAKHLGFKWKDSKTAIDYLRTQVASIDITDFKSAFPFSDKVLRQQLLCREIDTPQKLIQAVELLGFDTFSKVYLNHPDINPNDAKEMYKQAQLLQVPNMKPDWAYALVECGIDSVQELSKLDNQGKKQILKTMSKFAAKIAEAFDWIVNIPKYSELSNLVSKAKTVSPKKTQLDTLSNDDRCNFTANFLANSISSGFDTQDDSQIHTQEVQNPVITDPGSYKEYFQEQNESFYFSSVSIISAVEKVENDWKTAIHEHFNRNSDPLISITIREVYDHSNNWLGTAVVFDAELDSDHVSAVCYIDQDTPDQIIAGCQYYDNYGNGSVEINMYELQQYEARGGDDIDDAEARELGLTPRSTDD